MKQKSFRFSFAFGNKTLNETTGAITIEGYGATWDVDREGDQIDPHAFDKYLARFAANPILLFEHGEDPTINRRAIGRVIEYRLDDRGFWVKCEVLPSPDTALQDIYEKVAAGVYTTFSIGGIFRYEGRRIVEIELLELSAVTIPANANAVFSLSKSLSLQGDPDPMNETLQQRIEKAFAEGAGRDLALSVAGKAFDLKSGRVLSKANEDSLRQVKELLEKMLSAGEKEDIEKALGASDIEAQVSAAVEKALSRIQVNVPAQTPAQPEQPDVATLVAQAVEKALGQRTASKSHAFSAPAVIESRGDEPYMLTKAMQARHEGKSYLWQGKTMVEGTNTAGGFIVPPEYYIDEIVPLLRSHVAVRAAGVRVVPMKEAVLNIPKQTGAASAQWLGEGATISASDQQLGQITFTARKLAALVRVSNELLRDATPSAEKFVRDDLAQVVGLAEDLGFLSGAGAPAPTGLLNVSGVSTATSVGANGASFSAQGALDFILNLIWEMAQNNAICSAFIMHTRTAKSLSKVKDGNGNYILSMAGGVNQPVNFAPIEDGANGGLNSIQLTLLGRLCLLSNQLSITQTVGTSTDCSTIIGFQKNRVMIGQHMEMEMASSSEAGTAFETDTTLFRAIERVDLQVADANSVMLLPGVRP